jgi:hypothetical protein
VTQGQLPRTLRSFLPLTAALTVFLALAGCNSVCDMDEFDRSQREHGPAAQ